MSSSITESRRLGQNGEELAAQHLLGLGWTIVARNWSCPSGELDIIAQDCDGTLVFCEVKTRSGLGFGDPLEAITPKKIAKMRQLAALWLSQNRVRLMRVRFDGIGVLIGKAQTPRIHHVSGIVP